MWDGGFSLYRQSQLSPAYAGLDGSALTQQHLVYPWISSTIQVEPSTGTAPSPTLIGRSRGNPFWTGTSGDLLILGNLGIVPSVRAGVCYRSTGM